MVNVKTVYCCECGKRSDRGMIARCRACSSPTKEWLKNMAKSEDEAGGISVGGLAVDLGLPVRSVPSVDLTIKALLTLLPPADNRSKLFYLATYSHPQKYVVEARVAKVNQLTAALMNAGLYIFSPISHTHGPAVAGELPKGWEFWQTFDEIILSRCDGIVVHMDSGWHISKGVMTEIAIMARLNKPVYYLQDFATEMETK